MYCFNKSVLAGLIPWLWLSSDEITLKEQSLLKSYHTGHQTRQCLPVHLTFVSTWSKHTYVPTKKRKSSNAESRPKQSITYPQHTVTVNFLAITPRSLHAIAETWPRCTEIENEYYRMKCGDSQPITTRPREREKPRCTHRSKLYRHRLAKIRSLYYPLIKTLAAMHIVNFMHLLTPAWPRCTEIEYW